MSSYLNFFIRPKDTETLFPIADFSRNSWLYGNMKAPYGNIRPYSYEELDGKVKELYNVRLETEKHLKNYDETIQIICSMAGSIPAKMEEIVDIQKNKFEAEEYIERLLREEAQLTFIAEQLCFNYDYEIYAGIDEL